MSRGRTISEPTIRDVAEQIRCELSELAGPHAREIDRQLTAALESSDDDLFAVLAANDSTRARLDELLPDELQGERDFSPLPGHTAEPAEALIFRCPLGDYEWPAFDAGEPVPDCPRHQLALVRVD